MAKDLYRRFELLESRHLLSAVGFVTHELVPHDIDVPRFAYPFDVDSDGDIDLVTNNHNASILSDRHQPVWYPNLGGEVGFGAHEPLSSEMAAAYRSYSLLADASSWSVDSWVSPFDPFVPRFGDQVDLDADGDLDELHFVFPSPTNDISLLQWHENVDGAETFELRQSTPWGAQGFLPQLFFFADLNGDQLEDIIFKDDVGEFYWFENSKEQGPFSVRHDLPVSHQPVPIDLDGDRDIDLVTRSYRQGGDYYFHVYENDGNGTFLAGREFLEQDQRADALRFADLDNDKDLDVIMEGHRLLIGEERGGMVWLENDEGVFAPDSARTMIVDENIGSFYTANINGDAYLDVVLLREWPLPGVGWLENLGTGEFAASQEISETRRVTRANRAALTDVNADGLKDIAWASHGGRGYDRGWFLREPDGTFESIGTFIEAPPTIQDRALPFAADSIYVDMDGDGDLDLGNRLGGRSWFELDRGTYVEREIGGFVAHPAGYEIADLDGDGDADVIAFSAGRGWSHLSWNENIDGRGKFGTERVLARDLGTAPLHVFAFDIELDGDYDIVVEPRTGKYFLFENAGDGTFKEQQPVEAVAGGIDRLVYADGNADGLADQVLAVTDDRISWARPLYSKSMLGSRPWPQYAFGSSEYLLGSDPDGDGDTDIILARSNGMSWRENRGGALEAEKLLLADFPSAYWTFGDADRDGDLDVIGAGDGRVVWHENRLAGDADDNGQVGFEDFLVLSANFGAVDAVWESGDFTGDGDVGFDDFLLLSANFDHSRA